MRQERGELESSISSICAQAKEHVNGDELILTYGASAIAERFLRAAAHRKYKLILAEGAEQSEAKEHVNGDELILTYGASAIAERFLRAAAHRKYKLILAEGAEQSEAKEHVNGDELILTYGASAIAERFLRAAAHRKYKLILAEGAEQSESHAMANRLSAAGVSVTVISSASIYAVMSRVNKVVISVKAAMGGGAVLAEAGLHAVTQAARHYCVPVLALAPLYKLSPVHDVSHFNAYAAPHTALPYERHELATDNMHVYAPMYDFAPPDHITLFITNLGGSSPSYMYRMLSELYDLNDYVF
ncbi:hypothetical protein PYW07_013412 [Mythimna separata]|uniref:Translation initiation factor eIF2B subunit beta n=1 Tax=Mythimna separata TaxID=271217 RepID=A0AAD7Y6E7_MYTSE|nr:hypothetical protein PYW07_013412 [Mythimna separata]